MFSQLGMLGDIMGLQSTQHVCVSGEPVAGRSDDRDETVLLLSNMHLAATLSRLRGMAELIALGGD